MHELLFKRIIAVTCHIFQIVCKFDKHKLEDDNIY